MYFDIGANIGKWTQSNDNGITKIIAIEASPNTFNKLTNNINEINSKNLLCLNYAVCNNSNNPINFYHSNADTLSTLNKEWLSNSKSRFYNYDTYNEITVNTITIDNLIEMYGMPDLIKIDVEGGEYECIKSLSKKTPLLCFEWASEMNDITFLCLEHLKTIGYTQFNLQFQDNYTYRPNTYEDTIETLTEKLNNTTAKVEWGMIWCK
jgi:FkbM family methyltransferase